MFKYPAAFPSLTDIRPSAKKPAAAIDPSKDHATPTEKLAVVEDLLARKSFALEFPSDSEKLFQQEISEARAKNFVKLGLAGVIIYNSFLVTDRLMIPDIMNLALFVQLAVVSPISLVMLYGIHRRVAKPELGVIFCEFMILASILLFYTQSKSPYAPLLIFTVPNGIAFANIVLPLSFRLSVGFTLTCLGISALAVIDRQGMDLTTITFIILNLTTISIFMLFSTYRTERDQRKTYLFNRREKLRADVLAENNEQLRNLSETDGMTGVGNRRYFDATFERLWQAATQAAEPLALLIVDIDHFKRLNDTFGHQEGDHCLRAVAQCLQAHLMPNAVLARYGGEEFVVLLPGVNAFYACSCAEVLRSAISRLELIAEDGSSVSLTISIGSAAMIPTPVQRSAELLTAADQALYRAKANGRNRVENAMTPGADIAIAVEDSPGAAIRLSA